MAFSCQDSGTIAVTAAGLNWNDLVWGTAVFTPGNPSHGSGAASGAGRLFSGAVMGGPAVPFGGAGNPAIALSGSMSYTGPSVNCNLHLIAILTGSGYAFASLTITQDGIGLGSFPVDPAGVFDIPFVVADTAGVPSALVVSLFFVGITGDTFPPPDAGGGNIIGLLSPAF